MFSQKKNTDFIQPFPLFKDCKTSINPSDCFNKIISSKIIEVIETDVQSYLEKKEIRKSVNVYLNFIIDENGKPIEESISTTKIRSNPTIESKLKKMILNLPNIYPRRNEANHPILSYYHLTAKLGLDKENNNVVLLEETNEPNGISENRNFTAPVYPKCQSTSNKVLRKCFSNNVTKLLLKKYRINKAVKGFNKKGSFYTYILFKVDKFGEVNNYKIFGPNETIENEARRSLKKLKDLKPGTENGKPVNVSFALPLKFKIE